MSELIIKPDSTDDELAEHILREMQIVLAKYKCTLTHTQHATVIGRLEASGDRTRAIAHVAAIYFNTIEWGRVNHMQKPVHHGGVM